MTEAERIVWRWKRIVVAVLDGADAENDPLRSSRPSLERMAGSYIELEVVLNTLP